MSHFAVGEINVSGFLLIGHRRAAKGRQGSSH